MSQNVGMMPLLDILQMSVQYLRGTCCATFYLWLISAALGAAAPAARSAWSSKVEHWNIGLDWIGKIFIGVHWNIGTTLEPTLEFIGTLELHWNQHWSSLETLEDIGNNIGVGWSHLGVILEVKTEESSWSHGRLGGKRFS